MFTVVSNKKPIWKLIWSHNRGILKKIFIFPEIQNLLLLNYYVFCRAKMCNYN